MSEKNIIKSIAHSALPWCVAIILFGVVSYGFYAPQFEGLSLAQGDIQQYAGMSQDIREHRAAVGEDPQWTGNMFSGMPAYLIDMEYPTQSVKQGVGHIIKIVDSPANMTLFAMLLMMVAVVLMGVNPWIGIVAGLAYGLSTYFFLIIDAGHITKMWALVYAPPLVGAVWYTLRRNLWAGAALAALFGSLELGANHPQITYYFLLVCLALWLSELCFAWRERGLRMFGCRTAALAVAAMLSVASNLSPLWYTMQHSKYTTRGEQVSLSQEDDRAEKIAYNTMWSYGRAESFNMLVPNYMGSWSGDMCEEAIVLLQSRSVLESIFNDVLDDVVADLATEYPDITRADLEYLLEVGDEGMTTQIYSLVDMRCREAAAAASLYWGDQPFTAGPTYLGASVILLALLGLMLTSSRNRWWVVAVSLFALLLAWGSNIMGFYELMYDLLPAYKNFRTVSMALVVLQWSVPLVAAYALYELWQCKHDMHYVVRCVVAAWGVVVALVAVMALVADYGSESISRTLGDSWWVEQLKESVVAARREAFWHDAANTVVYATLMGVVVLGFCYAKLHWSEREQPVLMRLLPYAMCAAAAAVVVLDLGSVDGRYMNDDKWFEGQPTDIQPTAADREIMQDKELGYRVLDLTSDPFNSARASYFHRSVGGYHGAKPGRYQEVIDRYLNSNNGDVLAALNVRYVIYGNDVYTLDELFGVEPLGAAWFVDDVRRCATPAEELEALGSTDLYTTAVVSGDAPVEDKLYDAYGDIALVEYAPNRLKYEYSTSGEALAVFSEVYFPEGWTATVDGAEAEYFSVDYILRGMVLPAGDHTVEWTFRAPAWGVTSTVMGIASWLIIIGCVAVVVVAVVRRKRGVATGAEDVQ